MSSTDAQKVEQLDAQPELVEATTSDSSEPPALSKSEDAEAQKDEAKSEVDSSIDVVSEQDPEEDKPKKKLGPSGLKTEWKRVDHVYDPYTCCYVYRDTAEYTGEQTDDSYRDYCFLKLRKFDNHGTLTAIIIVIKSEPLQSVLHTIIGTIPAVSFNVPQAKINPEVLITYYPAIRKHATELQEEKKAKNEPVEEGKHDVVAQLVLLADFLASEYEDTLSRFNTLLEHKQMSFDLLYALFVPQQEYYTTDPRSGQPRAVILNWASQGSGMMGPYYLLDCEYVESYGTAEEIASEAADGLTLADHKKFGRAKFTSMVIGYQGAIPIHELKIFPMKYHPRKEEMRKMLITRGKKWAAHDGVHHKHYNGIAYLDEGKRIHVNSRVMVDKPTFRRMEPNFKDMGLPFGTDRYEQDNYYGEEYNWQNDDYEFQEKDIKKRKEQAALHRMKGRKDELDDDDYILCTPMVYGFSLGDKHWIQMNIDLVNDFIWNDEAFRNLVLPPEKKKLIQALVEAHSQKRIKFDDFIEGKGQGLVINLFGPPGVGKTLSAEATSELVRKPLYVVGAGDLGTEAEQLSYNLDQIFDVANQWGAVVLIDEADVFLEERSVHDIKRNALVAVFLRKLEYFSNILFLTTNRIKTFDDAFQSRIHIALRYGDLEEPSRRLIWSAFLKKIGMENLLSSSDLDKLAARNLNGRQIKNAVRTGQALAASDGVPLAFSHLEQVLDIMDQFEKDLKGLEQ